MKKQILLVCTIVCFAFTTKNMFGQLNVQAGFTASSWKFSIAGLSIETESASGINLGLNYRNRISSKFFLTPGLLISQKGAGFEFDFGVGTGVFEIKQSYLEIPVMFTYQSNAEKGFFAEGGPYVGFLLSAKAEDEDVKDNFKSIDAGIGLGLGYDFGSFILGLRGNVGLTSIAERGDIFEDITEDIKVTNNSGVIYGAYKF